MNEDTPTPFELYKLCLASCERVSDRRAAANVWMLSLNSALAGFHGLAGAETLTAWVVPAAGLVICAGWAVLLSSYRQLNTAKFAVLQQMERGWPIPPFTKEEEHYRAAGRFSLARIEALAPAGFALIYLAAGISLV